MIRPLYDRIVVKRDEADKQTESGILLANALAEKPEQGEVIATGDGTLLSDGSIKPLEIIIGDNVLFGKHSGQAIRYEGQDYLVMRQEDILGVITG